MTKRLLHSVLIASIVHLAAVTTSHADTRWHRHAPDGAGFSVGVPSDPDPSATPGDYQYSSGLWVMGVKIRPVDPRTRQLVERRERKALEQCLESLRDSMLSAVTAKRRDSSLGEIDGYPTIRFSFVLPMENTEFEATNLLVLTSEHLCIVMTVGPKGLPDDDAKRFLRSFRLVTTDAVASASRASSAPSTNPLAAKVAEPMLAVARLVIAERMSPLIDEAVQNAPPAARLGNRWSPSNAAWQQARRSISRRIERLADRYGESGQAVRTAESELGKLTTESQATIRKQLSPGTSIVALCVCLAAAASAAESGPEQAVREFSRALAMHDTQAFARAMSGASAASSRRAMADHPSSRWRVMQTAGRWICDGGSPCST